LFSNKFSHKNIKKRAIADAKSNKPPTNINDKLKYYESVTVRVSD